MSKKAKQKRSKQAHWDIKKLAQSVRLHGIARKVGPGFAFAGYEFGGTTAVFVDFEQRLIAYIPVENVSAEDLKRDRKSLHHLHEKGMKKWKDAQEAA